MTLMAYKIVTVVAFLSEKKICRGSNAKRNDDGYDDDKACKWL